MRTPSSTSEGAAEQGGGGDKLLQSFMGDQDLALDTMFVEARIRAAFYPKFDNDKSDQETRTRIVSRGLATMEVTLKHSGSLFMYAGHHGGAYTKNSYGNLYTAVGVFILGRMFRQAWGKEAPKMQAEFNDYLEKNRVSISMELVTAVLGDHGQRPKDDYAVVTAVTELGHGKPQFYCTPQLIAFCRQWRLPTNHVWLFSTRKSVTSFFAAYDALCEEGTATPVCKALDEIADISVPGSKDHVIVQGEILEGLVARIVSHESSVQMEEVLRNFSQPPIDGEESSNDPYAKEWEKWEKRLRKILFRNDDYLNSIQVPFEVAVKEVVEQLKAVAKGDIKTTGTAKRRLGNIFFAAVTLSQADVLGLVRKVAGKDTDVDDFLTDIKLEENLNNKVHITLAHKPAHGVAAVASYAVYQNQEVPVSVKALSYNDKMAALEVQLGMINGETIVSRNDWPHCTLWTAPGVGPKKANTLPQLVSEGKAKRVPIGPPITISGVLDFY